MAKPAAKHGLLSVGTPQCTRHYIGEYRSCRSPETGAAGSFATAPGWI